MLTWPRRLIVGALIVVVVGASAGAAATPAFADPFDPVPVYCDESPTAGCVVRAGTPGQPVNTGTGGGGSIVCHDPSGAVVPCYVDGRGSLGSDGCYYQQFETGPPPAGATGPGSWYTRSCADAKFNGPLGVPIAGNLVWLPDTAAPVNPEVLAQQAVSRLNLPIPAVRLNPAIPAPQLTGLPTWVWLDRGSWGSRSATATVPGVSVTATAVAAKLTLATGDGIRVTCKGSGTAWAVGTDPLATSPTCGLTFRTPGTVTVTATVTWNVSWAGGGQTGVVPALATTATVPVQVQESAGLNTSGAE